MRTFEQDEFPYIGQRPIAEIKPLALLEVLRRWGIGEDPQGATALRRGLPLRNHYR
ncbi:Uncharacterised protein [Serratia plymuthica]|uniref:Phage integrase central domain-containing protein n=1 Tax=Serratia plymuthica TaxID=82996 RepID=A0A2X4WQE1_SERPL|nr:Uncharacterised protein [Serratia plymuthica]SQI29155.1 Uncharacterised protein [Serratia plymuthica]